ncbi:MAG: META domain-containing protein [Flavobacteriales bacterium]|nr:META domain-containing protein [Flavobacteriales bacterium]
MKHLTLAAVLLLTMSAHKCNNEATGMTSITDTKWILSSLSGEDLKLPEGVERPWLKLAGDQLEGFGGCNSLMGQVKMDGTSLSFPGVGSTKKYCENVQPTENAIKDMLGKVDAFKMDGGLLKLLGNGAELATLKSE